MSNIHDAVEEGDLAGVQQLVAENPSCLRETLEDTPDQPLHLAAWQNHVPIVQFLIEAGADINARGDRGWSPLHYTAYHGQFKAAVVLCDAGADINQKDDWKWPALLYAARGREPSCYDIAHFLLDRSCEADLNSLISLGEIERVKEILRRDANAVQNAIIPNDIFDDAVIFAQSLGGTYCRPLLPEEKQRWIEKCRNMFVSLIAAGADINAIGLHRQTALGTAQLNSHDFPELVQILVELGAKENHVRS